MADSREVFNVDDIDGLDDDAVEFDKDFDLWSKDGKRKVGGKVMLKFRTPTVDECEEFSDKRQGQYTNKGRLKKLPNDLSLGVAAVNACVPAIRQWRKQKLWNLIRRTGGLIDEDSLVQFCYDLLGFSREDDEIVIGDGPTGEDYPTSSGSSSDGGDIQQ